MTIKSDSKQNSPAATKSGWRDRLRTARNRLQHWLQAPVRAWAWLRALFGLLLLIRFSLLLAVVATLVMLLNAQALDVLRALGEDFGWRTVWFVLAALLAGAIVWLATRVMFYFRFRNPASSVRIFPGLKEYLPRILGASVLALIGVALAKASWVYDGWFLGAGARLRWLAVLLAGLALGFVYVTTMRRTWFARWVRQRPKNLRSLSQLTWQDWLPLLTAGLAGFALAVLFAYHAVTAAPYLGTATVALLAVMALIPTGSLLVYAGNRARLPLVELLIVLAIGVSMWTDNHLIRIQPGQASYDNPLVPGVPAPGGIGKPPAGFQDVPDLQSYFVEWIAKRRAEGVPNPVPVIVVAAEGGGLRAAYWTALVLARLQDEVPDFARQVIAISGVSGGSLGAATFAALLADGDGQGACAGASQLVERADVILGQDFLAPTVASFLFRDLPQRFVPAAIVNDRGVTLEKAWEAAWRACQGNDRFAEPFVDLWQGKRRFEVPLLFLNATLVESGQRVIATPLPFDVGQALTGQTREPPCGTAFDAVFSDAYPATCLLGYRLPLSTAVHNSARFTYVSPAGTVPRHPDDDRPEIHLVDGGYFENSGAVTAFEILREIEAVADRKGISIQPIVLQISNDPLGTSLEERKAAAEDTEFRVLTQVRAPLKALLNVRPARGYQARASLRSWVLRGTPPGHDVSVAADLASIEPAAGAAGEDRAMVRPPGIHLHFRLCREEVDLPLGWVLSQSAQDEMRRQLGLDGDDAGDQGIVGVHRRNIETVRQTLSHSPEGAAPEPDTNADPWSCPG